jgi:hypothetical protein
MLDKGSFITTKLVNYLLGCAFIFFSLVNTFQTIDSELVTVFIGYLLILIASIGVSFAAKKYPFTTFLERVVCLCVLGIWFFGVMGFAITVWLVLFGVVTLPSNLSYHSTLAFVFFQAGLLAFYLGKEHTVSPH